MPEIARRRLTWTLIVAMLVLAVAAWSTGRYPPPPLATVEKLRIALPDVPHAALLHIAVERGLFAAEGLDVTIVPATHGKAAMEHLRQGNADLAVTADLVSLLAVIRGEPLMALASVSSFVDGHSIIARRDRNIAVPRDLAGKKIGVSFGTSGEYFLWTFLVRHRLAPEAVALVDLPPGRIAAALTEGVVDAVATWAPVSLAVRNALGDNAANFTTADAYILSFFVSGRSDFVQAHPQAMQKLLRVLLRAEEFSRTQPEAALILVAKRLDIKVEILRSMWKAYEFRVDLRQSQLVTLEAQARWAMARGHAAAGPVPNLLPYLYIDALLAVRPERVSVLH